MKISDLIARIKGDITARTARYNELTEAINNERGADAPDEARESTLMEQRAGVSAELEQLRARLDMYEAELREEQRVSDLDKVTTPTGAPTLGREYGHADRRADRPAPGTLVRAHDLRPAAVERGQRFADHVVAREMLAIAQQRDQATIAQYGDLGQMVRAITTTSGSAIVPSVWASDIIDRARNVSAVLQAGAQVVPMDAKTVQIGRLTGDPSAAFRDEGSAIAASDVTLDNVTLTAKSMNALVIGSVEWFQDADNADELVTNAIAEAIAAKLDLVALYGGITTGAGAGINLPTPPNPRGILAALNATAATSVLGGQANGTTQTATAMFDELIDTLLTPSDFNEDATALIYNSKLARLYAKAYDTTGQPLQWPAALADARRFVSNQIPSYTQGTMTTATDVFAGDFSKVLIGQRLGLSLQVLTERYADTGQIGIVATWRGDVGLSRPRALSVFKAIKGA